MIRYVLFLAKLKIRERPFLEGARKGDALWDYPNERLVVIKNERICPFVKFEIILPLLCCLLDPLMINLWIDSRTCQKYRIMLSARQRSNNYSELSNLKLLKWKFLRLLSARVRIFQIVHISFETTSQFLCKFCIKCHCHDT